MPILATLVLIAACILLYRKLVHFEVTQKSVIKIWMVVILTAPIIVALTFLVWRWPLVYKNLLIEGMRAILIRGIGIVLLFFCFGFLIYWIRKRMKQMRMPVSSGIFSLLFLLLFGIILFFTYAGAALSCFDDCHIAFSLFGYGIYFHDLVFAVYIGLVVGVYFFFSSRFRSK